MELVSVFAPRKYGIIKKNINFLIENLQNELNFSIVNLDINIVDKKALLKVNMEFLGHNYDTDIITFNYSGDNNILEGELLISYDIAVENAARFNCSVNSELLRLVIHGILHLVGYDDMNDIDRKKMKRKENLFVKKFNNVQILK